MPEQDLLRIARENVEAFNAGDWNRMKTTMAPNCTYEELATQRRIQGADQVVTADQGWKRAFPDAKGTITNTLATGNTVLLEVRWEGTHNGPLEAPSGTLPASGKRVTVPASMVMQFENDKIREVRHYFDMMTLLQQIGAMPARAAA